MMNLFRITVILAFLPLSYVFAQQADLTKGTWYNEAKTGRIQFFMKDSRLSGKVVWLKETGIKDAKNPDPELRSRPIIGIVNLTGFVSKDGKSWTGGKIYDPESGKTYSSKITIVNDRELDVRGYIGSPLLGRTTRFTRAD